eukprot:scaffold258982_cov33-Tisochrysis_lutea.AAC.1
MKKEKGRESEQRLKRVINVEILVLRVRKSQDLGSSHKRHRATQMMKTSNARLSPIPHGINLGVRLDGNVLHVWMMLLGSDVAEPLKRI